MNIIILDVHHPEDGRVNRHIRYMQNLGYYVFHININRYFPFLKQGIFHNLVKKDIGSTSEIILNHY